MLVAPVLPDGKASLDRWITRSDTLIVQRGSLPNSVILQGQITELS